MKIFRNKKIVFSIVIFGLFLYFFVKFPHSYDFIYNYYLGLRWENRELKGNYKSLLDKAKKYNDPKAQYQLALKHYNNISHGQSYAYISDEGDLVYEPIHWIYFDDSVIRECYYHENYPDKTFTNYKKNYFSIEDILSSRKFSCEEHNLRKAFYWAKKAAEQGFARAQVLYALILEEYFPLSSVELAEGLDVPNDPKQQAEFWMEKAEKQGHFYPWARKLIDFYYMIPADHLSYDDKDKLNLLITVSNNLLNNIKSVKSEEFHYSDDYDGESVIKDILYELNYLVAESADRLNYVIADSYWERMNAIPPFKSRANGGVNSRRLGKYNDAYYYYYDWISSYEKPRYLDITRELGDRYFAKKQYAKAYKQYLSYTSSQDQMNRKLYPMASTQDLTPFKPDSHVQKRLAEIYFNGLGMTVDYAKAKEISEYLCNKKKEQDSCNMYKAIIDKGY